MARWSKLAKASTIPLAIRALPGSLISEGLLPDFGVNVMLVLSRLVGKTIVIDEQVRVTVLGVKGDLVRLGINAPAWMRVDREEIHHRRMQGPGPVELEVQALSVN